MKKTFVFILIIIISVANLLANEVLYFWSGAITTNSGKVNAVLKYPAEKVRLMVQDRNARSEPVYSDFVKATEVNGNIVSLEITNLKPNTLYYYSFVIDGKEDNKEDHKGSFKTFGEKGSGFSFKFIAGSCNFFPNNRVYDKMRIQDPLFLLMPGDLHYANPTSSEVEPHRAAYEENVLQQPRESKFLQNVPIAYVWDDHDFCGDNNDGSTDCGIAAYKAYKEYVPYYPLGAPEGSNAVYQAFTVGRVRFIMTDLRSERKLGDIMSTDQKNWFKNEVVQAKNNNELICWVSSVSFSGTGSDNWGSYPITRTELSNFFRDSNIVNMFIISGDAHMLAIDNGTHTDFSDQKNNKNLYPILQSAALNNIGSDKGGEYSEGGTFPNPPFSSQWSTVEITDNGFDEICVRFICYRMDLLTKKQKIMTHFEFCRTILIHPYTPDTKDTHKHYLKINRNENNKVLIFEFNYVGKANIRMMNYAGKEVFNQSDLSVNNSYKLDATNIVSSGTYYVIIETDTGNFISKVEIN